jgi:N-methylhydantoinase B
VKGPINSGREGGAVTAARIAFKYIAAPDEPANDGSFRPLHVVIPDGKFLSAPGNAPMGMYSAPLPTVIDTVVKALVTAAPDHVAAGHHGNFCIHSLAGHDPKTGEPFYNLSAADGGWGASQGHDGPAHYKTMSHGDTLDIPIEVQEALYPLRVEKWGIRPDSAGAGQWRGGIGLEKVMTPLAPCSVHVLNERIGCPPWGILGGKDGAAPRIDIERPGKEAAEVRKANVPVVPGDRVRVQTSGGGGYGDPLSRDPALVAADVRLGYVTRRAAASLYGVMIGEDGNLLGTETAAQRKRLAAAR